MSSLWIHGSLTVKDIEYERRRKNGFLCGFYAVGFENLGYFRSLVHGLVVEGHFIRV
jgi:hypothetical protein